MGLPSTTAIALVACGVESGLEEATVASEACLVGLVAATSLPLSYAVAVAAGRRVTAAAASAILIYAAIAAGLRWVPRAGPFTSMLIASVGLATACRLAWRIQELLDPPSGHAKRPPASFLALAGRTAVPFVYVGLTRTLRGVAGTALSGRFITFPGGSLALLITTHLEAGPASACRLAVSMPVGGLGMLAFLSAFRFGCPLLGLGWGIALGYAAASATLLTVEFLGRGTGISEANRLRSAFNPGLQRLRVWAASLRIDRGGAASSRFLTRRMGARGFSPGLEALVG